MGVGARSAVAAALVAGLIGVAPAVAADDLRPAGTSGMTATEGWEAAGQDDVACHSQVVLRPMHVNWPQGFAASIAVDAYGEHLDRFVTLEVKTAGGWWPTSSAVMPAQTPRAKGTSFRWHPITLTLPPAFATGRPQIRAVMDEAEACSQAVSDELTLSFVPATHSWTQLWAPGIQQGRTSRGATASLPISVQTTLTAIEGAPPMTTSFMLQRRIGTAPWQSLPAVPVAVRTTRQGVTTVEATIPAFSSSPKSPGGIVAYRFAPTSTASIDSAPSQPLTVTYFNARDVARKAVRRKCPKTPVSFKKDFPTGSGVSRDPMVAGWVRTGKNRVYLLASKIDKELTIEGVKQVAYHECAHILQYQVYAGRNKDSRAGAVGWAALLADAKAVFSKGRKAGSPAEHMADCVAQAISGLSGKATMTGYGGTCSAAQIKAAKRLLRGKPIAH